MVTKAYALKIQKSNQNDITIQRENGLLQENITNYKIQRMKQINGSWPHTMWRHLVVKKIIKFRMYSVYYESFLGHWKLCFYFHTKERRGHFIGRSHSTIVHTIYTFYVITYSILYYILPVVLRRGPCFFVVHISDSQLVKQ